MYARSAQYYDALYTFVDFAKQSRKLVRLIRSLHPGARSVLDVACGTGKHLQHLSHYYCVEGLDNNPTMVRQARTCCKSAKVHVANMIDFDLGKRFDIITCLFSSIAYVRTVHNLQRAVAAMARHLSPRGVLLLEPYFTPSRYWVNDLRANFIDLEDQKLAWMYVSKRKGKLSILRIHYLIGSRNGFKYFSERHTLGLFTDREYRSAMLRANLITTYQNEGFCGRGLYIGRASSES